MTSRARQILLALAAAAAVGAGGCGSSPDDARPERGKGLPQSSVDALDRRLDEVQRRYDFGVDNGSVGACEDIEDSFQEEGGIDELVSSLPQDVDPELRTALERSIERVRELTGDCAEQAAANPPEPVPEPAPVPVEPVPVEPVPEETTPEKTKPEKTTPEPEPEPKPAPAPPAGDEDDGLEDRLIPPGQDGGVPAPAPRGRQGKAQRKQTGRTFKPGKDDAGR